MESVAMESMIIVAPVLLATMEKPVQITSMNALLIPASTEARVPTESTPSHAPVPLATMDRLAQTTSTNA
jgi:hypothetical protein